MPKIYFVGDKSFDYAAKIEKSLPFQNRRRVAKIEKSLPFQKLKKIKGNFALEPKNTQIFRLRSAKMTENKVNLCRNQSK